MPTEWGLFTRGQSGVKTPDIAVPAEGLHKLTLFMTAYSTHSGYFPLFEINTDHGHHAALVNFGGFSSFPYHSTENCIASNLFKTISYTVGCNSWADIYIYNLDIYNIDIYIYIYLAWAHLALEFSDEVINNQQHITIKHFFGDKQETILKTVPLCTLNLFNATHVTFHFRPSDATYNYLLRDIQLFFNEEQIQEADTYITSMPYIYIYI